MAQNQEEPHNEVITVLKARLTDPNSTNREGTNYIYDDMPRKDLSKNSYPRLSVMLVSETGDIIDFAGTMQYHPRVQIDIWVWAGIDGQDSMKLTISGKVYEGQKLLDYMARQVKNALDDNKSDFYDDTNKMWNYELLASVNMGQDPVKRQIIRHRIEIAFDMFRGA